MLSSVLVSPFPPSFLDRFSLSMSPLGCKAKCIVISFLVFWFICSSLVLFKNGPKNWDTLGHFQELAIRIELTKPCSFDIFTFPCRALFFVFGIIKNHKRIIIIIFVLLRIYSRKLSNTQFHLPIISRFDMYFFIPVHYDIDCLKYNVIIVLF